MKAVWILALGVVLWTAGVSGVEARHRHHKKAAAPVATAPAAASIAAPEAVTADAPPPQEQVAPIASSAAKVPVMVPTAPTTTQYDPAHGFPDHNGAFSAMLVVIPAGELQEFDRPASAGRHLDRVCCAEPGARLAIKLVFIGPQADWNGNANVTYDLQVIGPDGKIYGHSDYKGMVALQGKIDASGQGLYDNRPKVVVMQFEPQDAIGHYLVKAVLHDNVARLDLPLAAGVQLLAKGERAAATGGPAPAAPVPSAPASAVAAPSTAAGTPADSGVTASMAPLGDDDDAPAKSKKHRRRRHH